MVKIRRRAVLALPFLLAVSQDTAAQSPVTTPEQQFGHPIGADYVLPNYTDFMGYWERLAAESDRMVLDTIGTSEEGRPQLMAIITSPENHRNLERYRDISRRLALAEGLTDEEARRLADEGRAVVWIDGGLHATEVLGAQQLMESVYQLVSRDDPETLRILNDVIILAVHANPDGMELVSDWYMRNPVETERSSGGIPRLYQKYVGHDNNRDFYASTQSETENMNRVMYTEWYPQIVYNHHQTGPAGTVMFAPPFRDPSNHNYDPLILTSIEIVGAAMHDRFLRENKPGVTMRSGANYSTWWNGGLRTMPYFHNMIGLLTETIGNPTPLEIPFIPRRQIPHSDLPAPIEPQTWHFRQSVDYSVTANYAVLDIASRRRDTFLFNIYRMGSNAIARGMEDTWTHYPRHVARAAEVLSETNGEDVEQSAASLNARGSRDQFEQTLRDPALRDARGYIISADQADFLTAAKFVDALLETGVHVHRATSPFTVEGKSYPAGSFVVKTAQAFGPHVIDMFEPQDHPDDIPYPGGPPTPPYDNAGWTLAYQMGVQFDRILGGFDGPFERIDGLSAPRPAGGIAGSGNAGLLLSAEVNDAFLAVNRLLAAGHAVYRLRQPFRDGGTTHAAGTFYISQAGGARAVAERITQETGLTFTATGSRPSGEHTQLEPIRVALWDRYGGSMPSGWTRWLLERFEFPFDVVYPQTLDSGDLGQYDVIVFPTGAIPSASPEGAGGRGGFDASDSDVPAEFSHMTGSVTAERTVPRLREFLEAGGTIVTIGSSTSLAQHLGLPVSDALTQTVDGRERSLPRSEYYVPGSILEVRVDDTLPVAYGLPQRVDVMFDNSPVMRIEDSANVRPIAWFDSPTPLRSGWAWGEHLLQDGVAMAVANVGSGRLFLFGPEVLFRAQPHGTFKFVFNSLYATAGADARIR